jgi:hypothetical protein
VRSRLSSPNAGWDGSAEASIESAREEVVRPSATVVERKVGFTRAQLVIMALGAMMIFVLGLVLGYEYANMSRAQKGKCLVEKSTRQHARVLVLTPPALPCRHVCRASGPSDVGAGRPAPAVSGGDGGGGALVPRAL